MARVRITKLRCKRCGYSWIPRKSNVTICPNCKSPYWDKPRKRGKK